MQYKVVLEYSPSKNHHSVHLNLAAFLLNTNEKVEGNGCLVYCENPVSDCKAVQYTDVGQYTDNEKTSSEKNKTETITVATNPIPENIHKIVFVVALKEDNNTPESIKLAKETGICSLFIDESEFPAHCFDFADTDFEGGVVFYEIVRSPSGCWTERVIADGNKNTLNDFAEIYGIEPKKVVLSPLPPPLSPSPSSPPSPSSLPPHTSPTPLQQPIDENLQLVQLTKLKEENKLLKQQLQIERNRTTKLLKKCNSLIKENYKLLEQQLGDGNLLSELQMLFSESAQYHIANPPIKDALEICGNKLVKVQNLHTILNIIEELYGWWNEYRVQYTIRLPFWRPDSWSRFENKFPNHPITIKLKNLIK
jgi:stress response protein SCP2